MRTAQLLVGAAALTSQAAAICFFPEPAEQICYNVAGATPQNLDVREVAFIAKYLRNYQTQAVKQGLSPFWRMTEADADGCAEWQVTTKGGTWALAKLVGDDSAAVTFNDIATTIDGGVTPTAEDVAKSLTNCGTAGGQMGVIVNTTDPLYSSAEFVDGGFTTEGIVIKLVHNPDT
ncbi:hypothetical protein F4677DRAFT_448248 [Hypoxylon crocopeplum]|nr:hypothetical protein F4677DRAFT_448248 [Hypoxylon crocopeplum]